MKAGDVTLAVLIVLLWGFNFVVMKEAASEVPPFLLTALRFGLATVPAIFLVARPAVPWRILAGYGALFGIVKFGLLFTAFRLGSPAGLTSVLLQTQAFFTIGFAHALLHERMTRTHMLGGAVAGLGVVVLAWAMARDAGRTITPAMIGLVVAAAGSWGLANTVLKTAGRVDMLGFTVWAGAIAPVPMLALSVVFEGVPAWRAAWEHLTWAGAASVLYLAWPISVGTGWAWGHLLSRHPATRFAPLALLVPIVSIACGALIYGERMTAAGWTGSGLILSGLVVGLGGLRLGRPGRV